MSDEIWVNAHDLKPGDNRRVLVWNGETVVIGRYSTYDHEWLDECGTPLTFNVRIWTDIPWPTRRMIDLLRATAQ